MTRTVSYIALVSSCAFLSLALSGCGGGDAEIKKSNTLMKCNDNKVGTGGYVWTFVDIGGLSTVSPASSWDETTKSGVDYAPAASPFGDGESVCQITGSVGGSAADTPDPCGDTPLYATGGIGMSFINKNEPFNVCGYAGVRFKAYGYVTGTNAPLAVRFAIPTVQTDLSESGDLWVSELQNAEVTGGALTASQQEDQRMCWCGVDTEKPDKKTCFGFWGVTLNEDAAVDPTARFPAPNASGMTEYVVYWSDLVQPDWSGPVVFDPYRLLKLQWEIPANTPGYVFGVDDVELIPFPGDWCADPNVSRETVTQQTVCALDPTNAVCPGAAPAAGG